MKHKKLFIGRKIKQIRVDNKLTQSAFAKSLGMSTSYLNLMENNQRHVTATVLMALADKYSINITSLSDNETDRIMADLIEATADPLFEGQRPTKQELRNVALNTPDFAKAFLTIHQAHLLTGNQIAELDNAVLRGSPNPTPYEEVRDFFHYKDNYIHKLDSAGEALADIVNKTSGQLSEKLIHYLQERHGIKVVFGNSTQNIDRIRSFEPKTKTLSLNPRTGRQTQTFHLAHQISLLEQNSEIKRIAKDANFMSPDATQICMISLANYFAGSVILPYSQFYEAAQNKRHDLALLSDEFGSSIEQIAHRLSTLQRPGHKGVPFFFARVDQAGNITKRHSATKLQFARYGSACPLWNVHSAFETPGKIIRQLTETPDGEKYICIATAISKQMGGYRDPVRRYALALGCEISYASQIVYCDGLDIAADIAFDQIGISCRTCERKNCHQRSLPPINRKLSIDQNKRNIVPFSFE
ncbi:MAG: Cro/Cl family transcriptional regulator [Robiginitomaculum sp.]|nr:MAG: Cro/Cl family transcriptional regulator [Robiginitomaculum sp.]